MSNKLLAFIFVVISVQGNVVLSQNEEFTQRRVIDHLNSPWEILYGPGDSLWVTENFSYKVKRINIKNGQSTTLLDLSDKKTFNTTVGKLPQGGLMGMALHPDIFNKGVRNRKLWVYLAYVYDRPNDQPCASDIQTQVPCYFKTRIVRYTYLGNKLVDPVTIADNLPGSNDHNTGRLTISNLQEPETGSPSGKQYRLYYSIGDMGAGQFDNMLRTNNAQNLEIAEGKILRLNTEVDGDQGQDAWVPNDNPFYKNDTISAKDFIYSYGHRNPQGLVWGNLNNREIFFSAEHGPQSDDEINIIVKGGNYGWNRIAGYRDGNYDGLTLGGYGPVDEKGFKPTTIDPILSLFPVSNQVLQSLDHYTLNWPSVGPSSIDLYTSDAIPGWKNSLLFTTLKAGKLFRIKLNESGDGLAKNNMQMDTISYFGGKGRFRDLAISPDGMRLYLACDKGGPALGKNHTFNMFGTPPPNAGAILEFTYRSKEKVKPNNPKKAGGK